MKVRGYKRGYY